MHKNIYIFELQRFKYNMNRNVIKKKSILFDMKCCVFPRTYSGNAFNFGVHSILLKM